MSDTPRPRVFTCPRCKESYLGGPHEQLPDCPHCGHDYRSREGFRFDLLFLMILIVAMIGFLLLTSNYRSGAAGSSQPQAVQEDRPEKLPGW
jgi:uncharacterized protein (DUF983 family)